MPRPGEFLLPIGPDGFAYTLRVVGTFAPEGHNLPGGISFERWGCQHKAPLDDGLRSPLGALRLEPTSLPGVWREPHDIRDWFDPVYYRLCCAPTVRGQQSLF